MDRCSLLRRAALAALPLVLVSFPACGGGGSSDGGAGTSGGDATVAAVVNGEKILVADLDRVVENLARNNMPPDTTVGGANPEERMRNTARKLLIDQALILQAAKKEGLTVSEEEVGARYSQTVVQAGGQENFLQMLTTMGLTEEQVRKDLGDNMLIRKFFQAHVNAQPEITPEELRSFYDRHPEMFGPQPEANAQHILLRATPEMDDMARAGILARAEGILKELQAGADFGELAKQHSEDPTNAQQGGDLGWFPRGMMVAPFDSAAFALEKGQIGGPVLTQFGYHLIKLNDRRMKEGRAYEEVAPTLRNYVMQEKIGKASEAAVDSLRTRAKVQYR